MKIALYYTAASSASNTGYITGVEHFFNSVQLVAWLDVQLRDTKEPILVRNITYVHDSAKPEMPQ